jgi:integrase
MARKFHRLSDSYVERLSQFARVGALAKFSDVDSIVWDDRQRDLHVRFGRHRTTWIYQREHRLHGKRSVTYKRLGFYPAMTLSDARKAALVEAGRIAAGRVTPGRRQAVKFEAAFADYCAHLAAKAKRKGKPPRWLVNVQSIGNTILLPEYGKWPLADLSAAPGVVRDFHKRVTKDHGPVVANRAMQVLRACYRHAAKLSRQLPPALPTSAVLWNTEQPAEKGVTDFRKWVKAWRDIASPIRRGFTLACLLLGARRGELARLEWSDIDTRSRSLVLRNVKSIGEKRRDVRLPLSVPIIRAIKLARRDADDTDDDDADDVKVFPGCAHNPVRDKLPAYGHALRHAYASIGRAIGIDPLLLKMLMGHSLGSDVTEGYLSRTMLGGPLRVAQSKISADIVRRLAIKL